MHLSYRPWQTGLDNRAHRLTWQRWAKDHVNIFLYDGAIVPDPEGIITAGHDNQTARTVAVRQGEKINRRALKAMFKQIIANNRAGGWRKLKPKH
jgi:hypothetical protein